MDLGRLPGTTAPPNLEERRVRLRALRDDDADGPCVRFSDPEVMRYRSTMPVAAPARIRDRTHPVRDGFATREGLQWAIALHADDHRVGTATRFNISLAERRAEFECLLARMLWGRASGAGRRA